MQVVTAFIDNHYIKDADRADLAKGVVAIARRRRVRQAGMGLRVQ